MLAAIRIFSPSELQNGAIDGETVLDPLHLSSIAARVPPTDLPRVISLDLSSPNAYRQIPRRRMTCS
jgi:hypothetical protein